MPSFNIRLGIVTALIRTVLPARAAGDGGSYETPPRRTARQVLGEEGVAGPAYTVREEVVARDFLEHFQLESKFGLYQCGSGRMLKVRRHEAETMQRLLAMGETNAYFKALEPKLVSLPTSLVQIAKSPGKAVENVPKAVSKTFGRVGSFVGGDGKKGGAWSMPPPRPESRS